MSEPTLQALVDEATSEILGVGVWSAPPIAGQALRDVPEAEQPKLRQDGRKTMNLATGVITVEPPPAPPATRPKNLEELKVDWDAANVELQAAQAQYKAPGATQAQKADALADSIVALNKKINAVGKAAHRGLAWEDPVPNT